MRLPKHMPYRLRFLAPLLFVLMGFVAAPPVQAQSQDDYQLSTRVLDISLGEPAEGVPVLLEKMNEDAETWSRVARKETAESGRINDFLPASQDNAGIYRFTFFTEGYFEAQDAESLYPFVQVVFEIEAGAGHYHVPITLSPYGYSTYRGS